MRLPVPLDHRALIDRICAACYPLGGDGTQRRRWLESHAEVQRTEAAKCAAITQACSEIGFRFE